MHVLVPEYGMLFDEYDDYTPSKSKEAAPFIKK
jgi:hypothetical protein